MDEQEELSPEELAELMRAYKKELAALYRASALRRTRLAGDGEALRADEETMRADIEALKQKYGVRY